MKFISLTYNINTGEKHIMNILTLKFMAELFLRKPLPVH